MAAKKTARKTTARKKAASRKTGARKKTARARKTTGLVGEELPKSLRALARQLRRDIGAVERHVETAGRQTRRSLTRVVRDASHQLGALEARGQKEWRAMSTRARRQVEKTVDRVRRAAQKK